MARWVAAVRLDLEQQRCANAAAALEEARRRAAALAFHERLSWVEPLMDAAGGSAWTMPPVPSAPSMSASLAVQTLLEVHKYHRRQRFDVNHAVLHRGRALSAHWNLTCEVLELASNPCRC